MSYITEVLLVFPGDVVEHGIESFAGASLVEDIEVLEGLELILLMHVMFWHDFLELCARHIHTAPA